MASFTDEILKFSPYIQEIPVEDYVRVGMMKQQMYEEGTKKVQGYIDSIRGMDIAKDVHKQYVQERLTQMKGEVSKVLSADFSNNQLVNQIGGLASKISSDPIIQNALISTQRYKAELARLQKDKNEGKLTPDNEYDFQERSSRWLSDGDARSPFNESYYQHVDILGEFYKAYKEIHPDSRLTQDAIRIGKDGKPEYNPAIQQTSVEGVTPEKVARVAEMIFQRPDIQNQLRIEGKYNYRAATPQMLLDNLAESNSNSINNINKQIEDLQLQSTIDKTADKGKIARDIESLKNEGTRIISDYTRAAELINTNPEAYKTAIHKNNLKSQLIGNYSWATTKETFEKSPLFDAEMQVLKYEMDKLQFGLEQQKFDYQKKHDADVLNQDWQKAVLSASSKRGKKVDADGNPIDDDGSNIITVKGSPSEEQGEAGSASFYDVKRGKIQQLNQAMYQGVFEIANNMSKVKNPIKLNPEDNSFSFNVDPTGVSGYPSLEEARAKFHEIYTGARRKTMHGIDTEKAQKLSMLVDPLIRSVKAIEGKEATINAIHAPQIEKLKSQVGDLNERVGSINNKPITKNDLVDLWLSQSNTPEANNAKDRVRRRFPQGGFAEEVFGKVVSSSGQIVPIQGNSTLKRAYDEVSSKLSKNKELVDIYAAREKAFKESQTTYIPLESTIQASTPTKKEDLRTLYSTIANARIKGNDSKVIEEFQALLRKEGGSNEEKFTGANIYGIDRDNATGDVYLTLGRGGPKTRIKVQEEDLLNIPGASPRNEFWRQFGDELSLTNNTTTDVPINGQKGGEATAHIMPRSKKSKYSVKYHVTGNGRDYDLSIYVRDTQGNIIASEASPGLSTSMDGIMFMLQTLKDDTQLETFLKAQGSLK